MHVCRNRKAVYLYFRCNLGSRETNNLGWSAPRPGAGGYVGSRAAAGPLPAGSCRLILTARFVGASAAPAFREAIAALAQPVPIAWIRPGQAITASFRVQPRNVVLGEPGIVTVMRCG